MEKPRSIFPYLFLKVRSNSELLCWVSILVVVAFLPMTGPSLCLFKWAGVNFCPGCGLGHALKDALHLKFQSSFHHHPLGIPALLVLLYRIYTLTFTQINPHAKQEFYDARSGDRT